MAVEANGSLRIFPLEQRHNIPGEPQGLWSGRVLAQGASGGGDLIANLNIDLGMARSRLFLIKRVGYGGPDVGSDKFRISTRPDYFGAEQNTWSDATVDGHVISGDFRLYDQVWLPPQDIQTDPVPFLQLATLNVDTEDWILLAQGVFWDLTTLRRHGVSPIVRF